MDPRNLPGARRAPSAHLPRTSVLSARAQPSQAALGLVGAHKVEAGRINAIALASRSWAIIEDMPQMAAAATAPDFNPVHAMAKILKRLYYCRVHVVERRPATARIELCLRSE